MIRYRVVQTVKYGQFREALERMEELNRICSKKGIREYSCWAPVAGPINELVLECEYASLAEFEQQEAAFYGDPDVMHAWRAAAKHIIEGTGRSELLEAAPSLA